MMTMNMMFLKIRQKTLVPSILVKWQNKLAIINQIKLVNNSIKRKRKRKRNLRRLKVNLPLPTLMRMKLKLNLRLNQRKAQRRRKVKEMRLMKPRLRQKSKSHHNPLPKKMEKPPKALLIPRAKLPKKPQKRPQRSTNKHQHPSQLLHQAKPIRNKEPKQNHHSLSMKAKRQFQVWL